MSGLVIVDSGGANLSSVKDALARLGCDPVLSADAAVIGSADRLVLPGVGTAAKIMQTLQARGLTDALLSATVPLLGICVGMQVLFERCEEGDVAGLGLLAGEVRRMSAEPGVRIPHMGWNPLLTERASPLTSDLGPAPAAYFVHSYAAPVTADTVLSFEHGDRYAALVARRNVAGAQFHPERSAQVGAQLLRNFLEWQPECR